VPILTRIFSLQASLRDLLSTTIIANNQSKNKTTKLQLLTKVEKEAGHARPRLEDTPDIGVTAARRGTGMTPEKGILLLNLIVSIKKIRSRRRMQRSEAAGPLKKKSVKRRLGSQRPA